MQLHQSPFGVGGSPVAATCHLDSMVGQALLAVLTGEYCAELMPVGEAVWSCVASALKSDIVTIEVPTTFTRPKLGQKVPMCEVRSKYHNP